MQGSHQYGNNAQIIVKLTILSNSKTPTHSRCVVLGEYEGEGGVSYLRIQFLVAV